LHQIYMMILHYIGGDIARRRKFLCCGPIGRGARESDIQG
jgi:hypothetical protein